VSSSLQHESGETWRILMTASRQLTATRASRSCCVRVTPCHNVFWLTKQKSHTSFRLNEKRRNQRMRTLQSDLLSARGQPDTVTTASDVCGFGCASCKQPHERNAGRRALEARIGSHVFALALSNFSRKGFNFLYLFCVVGSCCVLGGWQHVVVLGPAVGGRERRRFRGRAVVSRRRRRQR
jgi:hypothetical protein